MGAHPVKLLHAGNGRSKYDPPDRFVGPKNVLAEDSRLRLHRIEEIPGQIEDQSLVPLRISATPFRCRLFPLQFPSSVKQRNPHIGI